MTIHQVQTARIAGFRRDRRRPDNAHFQAISGKRLRVEPSRVEALREKIVSWAPVTTYTYRRLYAEKGLLVFWRSCTGDGDNPGVSRIPSVICRDTVERLIQE